MRLYPLPLTLLFSLGSRQSPTATATSSPSTLLVQISSYFFSGGGRRSRRNDFCTGSLISRRVVVTAGHCLRCKSGAKVSVRLVEAKKTLLLRHISSYRMLRDERSGAPNDVAVLLLVEPISMCTAERRSPRRRGIASKRRTAPSSATEGAKRAPEDSTSSCVV
ncbi:hypothetical protein QR680_009300 [Steinernema hermaphroditum]|uniref:Peptidase S1 domain-containing protein n=1 Tax=Steinernema hermaphroditum TaxID=289476 RepID=A0AA39IL30_9BILA|nr:hypothetical protein QR680_009300 [Steinernema hermaphroditum]